MNEPVTALDERRASLAILRSAPGSPELPPGKSETTVKLRRVFISKDSRAFGETRVETTKASSVVPVCQYILRARRFNARLEFSALSAALISLEARPARNLSAISNR